MLQGLITAGSNAVATRQVRQRTGQGLMPEQRVADFDCELPAVDRLPFVTPYRPKVQQPKPAAWIVTSVAARPWCKLPVDVRPGERSTHGHVKTNGRSQHVAGFGAKDLNEFQRK
jgi:hypothetical protein